MHLVVSRSRSPKFMSGRNLFHAPLPGSGLVGWPSECDMTAKMDRFCKAIAKNGKPCRAAATASGLCFFHANPDKASELGRLGGSNKRSAVSENLEPLPALNSAHGIRDAVAQAIT